jgi:hypothetical protein
MHSISSASRTLRRTFCEDWVGNSSFINLCLVKWTSQRIHDYTGTGTQRATCPHVPR